MADEVFLYIGGFELPDKNAAAHRVLNNAKIFRELGKRVVFVGIDKALDQGADIMETKKDVQGFESYSVPYPHSKKQWVNYLTDAENYIKICEAVGNVEAIIFYNFQSVAMLKLMRYCRKTSIKRIADVTEWYSAKGQGMAYAVLKGADTWIRMRVLHKRMNGLIVISRYLEGYYKKCTNVVYLPPLVDLCEEKWSHFEKPAQEERSIRLVYAGSPGKKDRIDVLIDALQSITHPYHLDVIGITSQEYLVKAPHHSDFINKNVFIIFHGRLSHPETLTYVKTANFSCFFRDDDRVSRAGFPTKFVEAISCGTSVITNASSNVAEYIKEGENGVLININDVKGIAAVFDSAVLSMKSDDDCFDYRKWIYAVQNIFL